MGARGPLPKRSEDRVRRNKPDTSGITKGTLRPTKKPATPSGWHPIAKKLFKSLGESGQADYYQNSDWALAFSLCDDLSRYKHEEDARLRMQALADTWWGMSQQERAEAGFDTEKAPHVPKGGSAMKLTAIYSALDNLMVSEGARRRLRLELEEPVDSGTAAEVVVMEDYKKALGL